MGLQAVSLLKVSSSLLVFNILHVGLAHVAEHPPSVKVLGWQLFKFLHSLGAIVPVKTVETVSQSLEQTHEAYIKAHLLGIWLLELGRLLLRANAGAVPVTFFLPFCKLSTSSCLFLEALGARCIS